MPWQRVIKIEEKDSYPACMGDVTQKATHELVVESQGGSEYTVIASEGKGRGQISSKQINKASLAMEATGYRVMALVDFNSEDYPFACQIKVGN